MSATAAARRPPATKETLRYRAVLCRGVELLRRKPLSTATAAVYLKQLAGVGVLEEVKVGREKLFVNPRMMRLLTAEEPGDLSFRVRAGPPERGRSPARRRVN